MDKKFVIGVFALCALIIVMSLSMWTGDKSSGSDSDLVQDYGQLQGSGTPSPWQSLVNLGAERHSPSRLATSESGALMISDATRPVLDNFLSEHARDTPENIAAQFKATVSSYLTEPALSQAGELMLRYAAYRDALKSDENQVAQAPHLESALGEIVKLQQAIALREQYLGTEIKDALFGQEERRARYALQRQQIISVQGWSDKQREEELSSLAREFPREAAEFAAPAK